MFRFALGNLLSRPLRSALSILGLAVAIGGMVGLYSIAGGIDAMVSNTFKQIPGVLVQQRGAPLPLFSALPSAWGAEIRKIPGVGVVDPEVVSRVNLIDGETIISPPRFIVGLDMHHRLKLKRDIFRENIKAGRFLNDKDRATNHCLLSEVIAKQLKKTVGDTLSINRYEFEIVGIYNTGSMMLDVNILMDLDVVRSLVRMDADTICNFYVEPDGTRPAAEMEAQIEETFMGRDVDVWKPSALMELGLSGGTSATNILDALTGKKEPAPDASGLKKSNAKNDVEEKSPVEVRSAEDWSERFDEFSGDLDIFLSLMTTIGVVIAMLSIVNTMMMSVTERTTEFGILRANGWSKKNIVQLMTLESGLLGLIGGSIGTFIGWLGTLVVNMLWSDRLNLYAGPQLLLFSIVFSILIGIFGGMYPAWIAARMSPMESIRRG